MGTQLDSQALEAMRRQSGIRLDADGVFSYRGGAVAHPRVQALFHRGLAVRADGAVTLTIGRTWAYVDVESVAFFVRAIVLNDGCATASLLDGRTAPLAGAAIAYAPDDRFYLWFPGFVGPAVALRDAHQVLAGRLADARSTRALDLVMVPARPSPAAPPPVASPVIAPGA